MKTFIFADTEAKVRIERALAAIDNTQQRLYRRPLINDFLTFWPPVIVEQKTGNLLNCASVIGGYARI